MPAQKEKKDSQFALTLQTIPLLSNGQKSMRSFPTKRQNNIISSESGMSPERNIFIRPKSSLL